jgi:hypothetical protein
MLPQIDEAEKRARRTYAAPFLDVIAGPDAEMIRQRLALEQRREVVTLLCSIRILRGTPGARSFDPATVEVAWKGLTA